MTVSYGAPGGSMTSRGIPVTRECTDETTSRDYTAEAACRVQRGKWPGLAHTRLWSMYSPMRCGR